MAKEQTHIPCSLTLVPPESAHAESWVVQTNLTPAKTDTRGFGFYLAQNYDDLIDHPVAIGEFQILRWTANNTPHSMAHSGLHPSNRCIAPCK
jgi:predicted metalloprotease with PDZ domain